MFISRILHTSNVCAKQAEEFPWMTTRIGCLAGGIRQWAKRRKKEAVEGEGGYRKSDRRKRRHQITSHQITSCSGAEKLKRIKDAEGRGRGEWIRENGMKWESWDRASG